MKVVIAMDSFKGSMTSMEAGNAAKEGVLKAIPEAEIIVKPLADGGEGTMEALVEGLGGKMVSVEVSDPLGRRVAARYGVLPGGKTAIMEMSQASGLTLLTEKERNPYMATSFGVGEMIGDAIESGCRDFIIGIGGSATNDGGMGMLRALGFCFLDEDGNELTKGADSLGKVKHILKKEVFPKLSECSFRIACDVVNPLCGREGATYVYGPQKGLAREACDMVDKAMSSYADAAERFSGRSCRNIPGAGAAGGLGFAFVNFLGASLTRGADLVLQVTELEKCLTDADVFLTGEGKFDLQTAMGKGPAVAAGMAKKYGCKVYVFAGQVTEDAKKCYAPEGDGIYEVTPKEVDLEYAMQKGIASQFMSQCVKKVFEEVYITKSNRHITNNI